LLDIPQVSPNASQRDEDGRIIGGQEGSRSRSKREYVAGAEVMETGNAVFKLAPNPPKFPDCIDMVKAAGNNKRWYRCPHGIDRFQNPTMNRADTGTLGKWSITFANSAMAAK
jgi:hypothetical protein